MPKTAQPENLNEQMDIEVTMIDKPVNSAWVVAALVLFGRVSLSVVAEPTCCL